ncbi:hypothetical protein F8M41_018351 [Gigaspora margarita]|uniref:Uncharacterized protein n=1 Tax=Gigaspora margarita TaxID=4874 RepID=A0A8H4ALT9_GIGMA|nr:hypothetical protein F8M41_018351 [Gigaspora margarita]
MTSNSDNSYVEISIEDAPDKNQNKEILEIVCSPNLKHIAELQEDNHISLWSFYWSRKLSTDGKPIHIDNMIELQYFKQIYITLKGTLVYDVEH